MRNSLSQHGLASARGTIQQNTPGRVNTNLSVQFMVCQRKFHSLLDLLLLNVITSDVLKVTSHLTICLASHSCPLSFVEDAESHMVV